MELVNHGVGADKSRGWSLLLIVAGESQKLELPIDVILKIPILEAFNAFSPIMVSTSNLFIVFSVVHY